MKGGGRSPGVTVEFGHRPVLVSGASSLSSIALTTPEAHASRGASLDQLCFFWGGGSRFRVHAKGFGRVGDVDPDASPRGRSV